MDKSPNPNRITDNRNGIFKKDIKLRWIVILCSVPFLIIYLFINKAVLIPLIIVTTFISASNAAYHFLIVKKDINASPVIFVASHMVDIIAIALAIFFTGGMSSPLFLIYFVLLVQTCFEPWTKNIFFYLTAASLGSYFVVYLIGSGGVIIGPGFGQLFARSVFLVLVGVVSYNVAKKVTGQYQALSFANEEKENIFEELKRLNEELEQKVRNSTENVEKTNLLLVKKNISLLAAHEIYKTADRAKTGEELLDVIMGIVVPLMKGTGGMILSIDESKTKAKIINFRKLSGDKHYGGKNEFELDKKGSIHSAISERKSILFDEVSDGEDEFINNIAGTGSCIVSPIMSGGDVTGIIFIYNKSPFVYNKTDAELMELLGEQVGTLLHNRVLYEEISKRAAGQEKLMKVMSGRTSSLNVETILNSTLTESIKKLFPATSGVVMMADEKNKLRIEAYYGLKGESLMNRPIPKDSIAGFVFSNEKNLNIKDTSKIKFFNQSVDTLYLKKAAVLAPISKLGKTQGVLCITKSKGVFTRDELHFLALLGNSMASDIEIAYLYEKLKKDYISSIHALAAAVDAKDHYTHGHSTTVMKYAEEIARAIDMPEWEVEDIRYAALLHDIGKIGISESIINKPAKLTKEEYNIMKLHPQMGAEIVSRIESLKKLAPLIGSHHEWINGAGYPLGLRGEEIPLGGRIIGVADAYATMTSKRPYRDPRTVDYGVTELRACAGTQFDRDIVNVFIDVLKEEDDQGAAVHEAEEEAKAKKDSVRVRLKLEGEFKPDSIQKDEEFYS